MPHPISRSGIGSLGFLLLPLCLLLACAGSGPLPPEDPAARKDLDAFFLRFRQKIQEGQADSIPLYLSRESLNWLDDMRRASRTEAPKYLAERPFHEILGVLALRVERRLNPSFDDRPVSILDKLVVNSWPVRKSLIKTELGESRVRGNSGEIGLREAPNVPVFLFTREGGLWKFHLHKSLPLILQGAESLARQRKSTHLEQAILVLEQYGGVRVLPEDLNR
ncbi:MAG: hypothetical protein JWP91_1328 [Fibrobacteres bacterium]|nr:hypothetical protein [Fibrobacterota bacterium]